MYNDEFNFILVCSEIGLGVRVMVSNATFNNILVISWLSILLVVEIREKHWPAAIQWQYLSHNVLLSTLRHEWDSSSQHQLITWVVINPYYYTLTTTMLCNMIYKRCHLESRQYFVFSFLSKLWFFSLRINFYIHISGSVRVHSWKRRWLGFSTGNN